MTDPRKNKPSRASLPLIALVMMVVGWALWMLMADGAQSDRASTRQPSSSARVDVAGGASRVAHESHWAESASRTKSANRTKESLKLDGDAEAPRFPMIDAILGDVALTPESAAKRLLDMAADPSLSVREREEALAHGLNLDTASFLGLTAAPSLPIPMASRLLDAILNHNEFREVQVTSCLALMGHEDPTIREQATKQLAFYIGLEEWSHDPDTLRKEATEFLRDLAKSPQSSPQLDGSDFDLPAPDGEASAYGESVPSNP
jgi:hypothetical protein